jgi:hypothetical protein
VIHLGDVGSAPVCRTGDPDLNPGPDENFSLKINHKLLLVSSKYKASCHMLKNSEQLHNCVEFR